MNQLACLGIPQTYNGVVASRQNAPAVRTKGRDAHGFRVLKNQELFACLGLPNASCVVIRPRHQARTVRTKGGCPHDCVMFENGGGRSCLLNVPQARRMVGGSRNYKSTIGAKGRG